MNFRLCTFLLLFASTMFAQSLPCWTVVGSDGGVDEADRGVVALSDNSAAVSSSAVTATVDIRYNVVAVASVFGGESRTKTLVARMADNGANAQVQLRLQQLNVTTGVITTLADLDSNDYPAQTTAQRRSVTFNCQRPEFDFEANVYYIQATLKKTGVSGTPLIRSIQICGNGVC